MSNLTEFKDEEDYEDLIKRLIDLKGYLEKRLKDLEDEVERIKIF